MTKLITLLPITLVALFSISISAQQNPDIENLYAAVTGMETAPFSKETTKKREKALLWVIETDKVSVTACGGSMSAFLEKKNKYGSELSVTYTLAMAAFKLRNPDETDDGAAQLAGVESALRAYEAILKEKPKAQFEAVDALIDKRNSGELAGYLEENGCGG